MSGRSPFLGALTVLTFFAGVTGVHLAFTLAYILGLTLAVAWLWSALLVRRLEVRRDSPTGSFTVGESFEETFVVRNGSLLPLPYCEIRDHSSFGRYEPAQALALAGKHQSAWVARGMFMRRGRHDVGPLEARVCDPFGLFPRTLRAPVMRSITVYPRLHHVVGLGSAWSGGAIGDGGGGRVIDAAPSASTVREYLPEDGFGRIHWASTARAGRLMSRSYATPTNADVIVVLDLQAGTHAGVAPESSLEYAISIAASMCHAVLRRGQAVSLVTNDALGTAFGAARGEIHRSRILDYLATAGADGRRPIAETIARLGGARRTSGGLAVVTSSNDRRWVEALVDSGARGARHLAVLVDASSFGGPGPVLRPPAAWRLALHWWVVRRGDRLSAATSAPPRTA